MKTEFFGVAPLLQVYDMPSAVRFYRDVLGFELLHQSQEGDEFDWCLLTRSGAEIMLNAMYERERRPPEPDTERSAARQDIGLFFPCHRLDAAFEHLRAHGVDLQPPRKAPYGIRLSMPTDERWAEQWRKRYGLDV